MSTTSEKDQILMLHAPDGEEWATFLAARLSSPTYSINSVLCDVTSLSPPVASSSPSSSSQNKPPSNEDDSVYINESQEDNVFPESPKSESGTSEPGNDIASDKIRSSSANSNTDNASSGENFNKAVRKGNADVDASDIKVVNIIINGDDNPTNTIENNNKTVTSTNTSNVNRNSNNIDRNGVQSDLALNSSKDSISQSVQESRVCVIFISPRIIESESAFFIDMETLKERNTVFVLLGVELAEVMAYFGPLYYHVSRCRCCFIDGTEETICGGIITIIESYEDEGEDEKEDIYKIPNQPIQRNMIEKVFPRMLTETERDVHILLSRIPEDDVQVVLSDSPDTLPLVLVCERLYSFTLPDDIHGEVTFQLECQGRRFGHESVHSHSKLDLVQNILTSEINPQSLIASSLGLDKDDIGGMDTALAFKLQELAPVMTFKALCPCEEALKNASCEERSDKMWPTLLHFAADLNLRLLCSELLRYPGMVAAACKENRDGEFPSQIASRKGYFQIENDLVQFVKRRQREVDPDHISSSQCNLSSESHYAVTDGADQTDSSETYCDMGQRLRPPQLDRIRQKPRAMSDSSLFRRKKLTNSKKKYVAQRSDSGYVPSQPPVRTHSDRSDISRSSSNASRRPLPKRPDIPTDDFKEETYSNLVDSLPSNQGSPTSMKALKRLGATEKEVASRYSVVDPKIAENATFYSATCPPGTLRVKLFQDDDDSDRMSVSSNCEQDTMECRATGYDPKKGQIVKSVKGFFHKMKGNKKSTSEIDLFAKKNSASKLRRGSEPADTKGNSNSKKNSHPGSPDEERDSGSYSDEEKKPKVFKERNKQMNRRMSKRIESAKKECYEPYAPQVPVQDKKRETFKSFIF